MKHPAMVTLQQFWNEFVDTFLEIGKKTFSVLETPQQQLVMIFYLTLQRKVKVCLQVEILPHVKKNT